LLVARGEIEGFFYDLLCAIRTTAAAGCHSEAVAQLQKGIGTAVNRFPDLFLGDSVAKADVHVAWQAKGCLILNHNENECQLLDPEWDSHLSRCPVNALIDRRQASTGIPSDWARVR
jgi:hypothetical protein